MNLRRPHTNTAAQHAAIALLLGGAGLVLVASCGTPDADRLFGNTDSTGGAGGAGGNAAVGGNPNPSTTSGMGGVPGFPTATTTTTGGMTTSTTSSSSSTGGAVCGDGNCDPTEDPQTCPDDCSVGPCAHSVCELGSPLDLGCDTCVDTVCAADPFCCQQEWDDVCVSEADQLCGAMCCGDGICSGETCESCPADCGACVCGDGDCINEDCVTCPQDCGACMNCPHTVCFAGAPLDPMLCQDPCVSTVCAQDPSCCGGPDAYGPNCTALAAMLCPGGNPCVVSVCNTNPACCSSGWDASCVALATSQCGTSCNCTHSVCQDGGALDETCNPCVADVCAVDPYCCDTAWDGLCVNGVATLCGVNCP